MRVFTNKIEFFNPGGLPKPIDELKDKDLSMPRNPILSKLFRMVKLAENAGFGFDKMESNWFKYNKSVPEYNLDFDSVTSSFFLVSNDKTEQVTEQVMVLIQSMDTEYYATSELRKKVGVVHKPTFLYNYLKPSLALGLIAMTQPNSPNSPTQRYGLTQKGQDLKNRKQ